MDSVPVSSSSRILHIDMNKYYASVEQMLNPSLRGLAIAVCGSTEEHHGIVLTASAEAKAAGVRTGMSNMEARGACPNLIMVPPHYEEYVKYSRLARSIYAEYSDLVEPFGMDECWVDISRCCSDFEGAEKIADEIRVRIREELGLTVSIGVSFSKVLAKLGSDMKKPDAVTVLSPAGWKERVWVLPASDLLMVGSRTARKLRNRGVFTIGDIAHTDPRLLQGWMGKNGIMLWRFASGLDNSRVQNLNYSREVQSVGHGITCSQDLECEEEVWRVIVELCQDIGYRLRLHNLAARRVHLYVRRNDLGIEIGNQTMIPFPTQSPLEIAQAARELFTDRYSWEEPVRSVTVSVSALVPADLPLQLDVFGDAEHRLKRHELEDCIYEIRSRFGDRSIRLATQMGDLHMPQDGRDLVTMPGMMYM